MNETDNIHFKDLVFLMDFNISEGAIEPFFDR